MPDDDRRAATDYATRPDPHAWGPLELRRGDGVTEDSFRHWLNGRAVHCGDVLDLRPAHGVPFRVRYEVTHSSGVDGSTIRRGKLCVIQGGLEFARPYFDELDGHLQFRWPRPIGGGS